ncbi:N-6 DNA methylase [Natrinema altunense]|nr:N-6 DNA methylase [Natrinema altunense]
MSKSRDKSSGIYVTTYSPAKILLYLAEHGEGTTADIREFLDCSHSTALKKLHSLEDVGILNARQFGNAYVWTLNTDRDLETNEIDIDPGEAETLLSETLAELATDRANSSNELPGDVRAWVDNRGIPKTVSTSQYAYRMAMFRRFLHAMLYTLHLTEHPELRPLSAGDDWDTRFELARESIDDSGLSWSPVDGLLMGTELTLDTIILALRHAIAGADNPSEALGNTYEELVPQEARRELGQFATPPFISRFMASWTVQQHDDTVLDPGIGAGQLATQALIQKAELGAQQPLAEIVGIDIDEIAVSMASVTLKLTDGEGQGDLRHGDFINQSPRQFAASGFEIEQFDAVVANPPYSRHQALEKHLKKHLNRVVSRETSYEFSQRTPLYGYFLIHAAQFLAPGGRMAAIIPSRIFDTKFGEDIKEYLLDEFSIHGIIQFDESVDVFESVKATPSIMLLEKGDPPEHHKTKFLKITSWEDGLTPKRLLSETDSETVVSTRTDIAQELLSHRERWSFYLGETEVREFPEATDFREIATIQRGIATGANDFFCLTQDEVDEWSIPRMYRKPIIRTARGLSIVNITTDDWEQWKRDGDEVWLLYCYTEDGVCEISDIKSLGVLEYLEEGEATGATDGHLVSNRNPWYRVEKQSPAPILGKYMNRTGFLFMRNDVGLLTLNNVHTIYLDFEFSEDQLDALLAYLNSNVIERVLSVESHDYHGLQKLEISQLENTPVIDPRQLSSSKRQRLANLFNYLGRIRRMDLDDSELLRAIDDEIEPLLGLETDSMVEAGSE